MAFSEKISVITASYNYANIISETIESVIAQTYPNWELIIVDDGSKDNSVEVIEEYCKKDARIKLFRHPEGVNKGLKATVLLGIEKSSSDWIAFLESDDLWTPNYFEEKIKVIEESPKSKFIFNEVEMFGDEEIMSYYSPYFELFHSVLDRKKFPADLFRVFSHINLITTFSCVMLHKSILANIDFNANPDKLLDYWIFTQIAYHNKLYFLNKKLTLWRMHKNSYINLGEENNQDKSMPMYTNMLKFLLKNNGPNFKLLFFAIISQKRVEKLFRGLIRKILPYV